MSCIRTPWRSVMKWIYGNGASHDVFIDQYPKEKVTIGIGGSTKLVAKVSAPTSDVLIKWQKMEDNGQKILPTDSPKYSGSSCSLPSPELVINDIDKTDSGFYQLSVTRDNGNIIIGPKVQLQVFGDPVYSISKEENNFLRFYLLCQTVATESVRMYFTKKVPQPKLASHLNSHMKDLKSSYWKCTSDQLNVLFPAVPSHVKTANFDFTLLYKLIRNTVTPLSAPTSGWGLRPLQADIKEEDDIERIRHNRNVLAHNTEFKLNDLEFINLWTDLSEAIVRLSMGALSIEVMKLKKQKLDRHSRNEIFENLQKDIETAKNEMNILHQDMSECKVVIVQHDKRIKMIEDHHMPSDVIYDEFGIIQDIQLDDILDYMITQLVLSVDDRCHIEQFPRQGDRNKALLDIVYARGKSTYVVFILALEDSCFTNEASQLKDYCEKMDTSTTLTDDKNKGLLKLAVPMYRIGLQKNYSNIISSVSADFIIDDLIQKDVFTIEDSEMINSYPTSKQKNRKLMDILLRRSEKDVIEFLKTLKEDEAYGDITYTIEQTNVTRKDILEFQRCNKYT